MVFAERLASQLAHPRGMAGLLLGKAMDVANLRLTHRAVELLAPEAGEAVLDAGCGTGKALDLIRSTAECRIIGIDSSHAMLASARKRLSESVDLYVGRIEDATFSPESFDAILALNVFYFAGDNAAMPSMLHKLLRPGGRLIAYVTAREAMEQWSFTRAGHHRLYDETELAEFIAGGGFDTGRIDITREDVGGGVTGLFAYARR